MYSDLSLWFSYKGRVNRRPYFFASLVVSGLVEARKLLPEGYAIAYVPVMLLAMYVGICLGIKRCHDRERTGFFLLLNVVPILNLWPMIELTFFKGTSGPNKYGPDPLASAEAAAAAVAAP